MIRQLVGFLERTTEYSWNRVDHLTPQLPGAPARICTRWHASRLETSWHGRASYPESIALREHDDAQDQVRVESHRIGS